jgi:hypothetical protein
MDGTLLPATEDAFMSGKKIGTFTFADKGLVPMDTELGTELDGRLYTDLSRVSERNPVTRRFRTRQVASFPGAAIRG